ncbi:MAG TPA: hypothetical protein OIM20_04560 [Eggerthellaceae bacterium]|nr:hypothetical protein [Eggerthellaceae bacterium]
MSLHSHEDSGTLLHLLTSIFAPLILVIGIPVLETYFSIIRSSLYFAFEPQELASFYALSFAPAIIFGIVLGISLAILLLKGSKLPAKHQKRYLIVATILSVILFALEIIYMFIGPLFVVSFNYQIIAILVFFVCLLFVKS